MRDHEDFDPDELLLDPDEKDIDEEDDPESIDELQFSADQRIADSRDVLVPLDEEEETEEAEPEAESIE
ncbi:MAG: hypothetical protein GF418_01240 [Chitinivibrionales bacterium]|nr:hypothetical protein [Chitinivibrionales bacterium]MBD3394226.1 hypothetical protein [Chitinivibrionales bacterium]